jgi:hypothetical protein
MREAGNHRHINILKVNRAVDEIQTVVGNAKRNGTGREIGVAAHRGIDKFDSLT